MWDFPDSQLPRIPYQTWPASPLRVSSRLVIETFAGGEMDVLGWCILLFTALLFSLVAYGYLCRTDSIPNWPTIVALVTEVESCRGALLPQNGYTSDHCKVYYGFSLGDKSYESWFVLMTEEHGFADGSAEKLRGKEITIRYNPKHPQDSVLLDDVVLGKKVIQSQNFL
jgi:hypothetical protein